MKYPASPLLYILRLSHSLFRFLKWTVLSVGLLSFFSVDIAQSLYLAVFRGSHLLWHRNHSSINSIASQLFGQILAKLMLLWSEESTDPPFNAIWKASDDPKHTANYVKAYLDRKKKTLSGTLSFIDWPPQVLCGITLTEDMTKGSHYP